MLSMAEISTSASPTTPRRRAAWPARPRLGQQVADGLFLQRHDTASCHPLAQERRRGAFGFMNLPTSGSSDTDSARAMARPARGRWERSSATE